MPRWWRCSLTFMGAGESANEMRQKMRMLFDGIPLRDLHLNVNPMSDGEIMRALDREDSKRMIERDSDSGEGTLSSLVDTPIIEGQPSEPRLLGGMVPAPNVQ